MKRSDFAAEPDSLRKSNDFMTDIKYLLGIDIGTSACKVAVFSYDGSVKDEQSEPYPVLYPHPGYAEQNPVLWYDAVCTALKKIAIRTDMSRISAVGIDGQGWSCIPVDKNGNVLSNTPIWYDTRATEECRFLNDKIGFDRIFGICGNPIAPSYITPKVLWMKNNRPDVYRETACFLQSDSYIIYRMTGLLSGNRSQGYGHFFYDIRKGTYDDNTAEDMGIDLAKFPKLYDGTEIVGEVTPKASEETGLPAGIPVCAGGLDAAAGTLGIGVINDGETQEQGGQAGGMSICSSVPVAHPKLILCNHVVPGKWLLQGGTVAGGASMEWFASQFGNAFSDNTGNVFSNIDSEAASVPAGSNGIVFLPYLNGERSPIWDTDAKGMFYGLKLSDSRGAMARAVMEGVAFSLRHNLETAMESGAEISELFAMGGSAKSRIWMQIKADITGETVTVCEGANATARGAAILAGIASGVFRSFEEALVNLKRGRTYKPDINNKEIYNRNYDIYKELYIRLQEVMKK